MNFFELMDRIFLQTLNKTHASGTNVRNNIVRRESTMVQYRIRTEELVKP